MKHLHGFKASNIFVEGLQGSGKSTLLRLLGKQFPDYHVYSEGDYCPVELAWCSYMTEPEYHQALAAFPALEDEIRKHTTKESGAYVVEYTRILAERRDFYEYMERYEIYNGRRTLDEFKQILLGRYTAFRSHGNLFECAFFQNTVEELLLYGNLSESEILSFYKELFETLKHKNFFLIYLHSEQIEENILQIKRERSDENGNELWYPMMLAYLNSTPYGKEHPFETVTDMVSHFKRRSQLELKIIKEVLGTQAVVIPAKAYRIEELVDCIL